MIPRDEIIEPTKAVPKKGTSTKTVPAKVSPTKFYILLAF